VSFTTHPLLVAPLHGAVAIELFVQEEYKLGD